LTNKKRKKEKNMASKNKNPYRDGSAYHAIFNFIQKAKGIVTRTQLLDAGFPVADVTVVLSPRAEGSSTRGGDPRGNMSAQGHLYFMDKLNKKKGEDQKFRLRWRKAPLDKRVRPPKADKNQQKSKTASKKSKKTSNKSAAVA
jgi:hypothetical protein